MCAFGDIFVPDLSKERVYSFIRKRIGDDAIDSPVTKKVMEYLNSLTEDVQLLNEDVMNDDILNYKYCVRYIKWLLLRYNVDDEKDVMGNAEDIIRQNNYSENGNVVNSLNELIELCRIILNKIEK
ncbi:MAG: hypothetical protein DRP56_04440 [Planctomycetota bacterium]|nr:MAG: hypothetical protein DRP56_04440 [Planctomycetota bacterium]